MQKDSSKSSLSGPVDDMHNCDVLPGSCGRHNESEREREENSDEMLTAQGTSGNPEGVLLNVYRQHFGRWDTYLRQRGTSLLGSSN